MATYLMKENILLFIQTLSG